jgi:hypothetical protein
MRDKPLVAAAIASIALIVALLVLKMLIMLH